MSPCCPKCSTVFTAHPTNLPIILPSCLHHLCSSCVTSSTQSQVGEVQCCEPQCQAVLTRGDVQQLLLDRHLLGSLAIQHKTRNHRQGEMSDDLTQFSPPSSQIGNIPLLCVKCRDISQLICSSCKTSFCSSKCFSLLHRTPVLATHHNQPYEFLPFTQMVCKEHGKNIEFVAVEGLGTGCSFCSVFGELKGRNVVELSRVIAELRDSGMLKMIVDKTNISLEKMLTTNTFLSTIESTSSCYEDNVNRLESHMNKCHRMLEVAEGRLTTHLRQREEERMQKLSKSRKEIDGKMTKLEQLLKAAEWQLENMDEEKYNMLELMKEMDKLNKEDHAVGINDLEQVGDVTIDESIFSSISSHISVMHQATPDPVKEKAHGQSLLEQASVEVIGRLCDKGEIGSKQATAREDLAGVEDVVLLHVESPESFFVMRTRDWKVAEMMRSQLRMKWMEGGWGKVKVDDIAVFKDDDATEYHRVKVITVESDLVWVTFIDQGNNSQVPLTSLVCMSEKLSTWPPMAHHCTLAGVSSEHDWSEEASRGVRQFCGRDVCKATVLGSMDCMGKDIMIVTISKEEDQADISLLDFLVFKALASNEGGGLEGSCLPTSFRSFLYLPLDRTVKEHLVRVVHVDTPDQMYINLVGENHSYVKYLDNLMEKMQEEYGRYEADDQKVIYPYVGLVCVAQHVEDGKYRRAQVTELLQEEKIMVRVILVDIGYCQVVHNSSLRRICDKFLVLPAMAIRVSLGGVRPGGEGWSNEANKYVKEIVINMMVRMTLQDMKTGVEDECKVMFEDTQGISINTMIVKKGYAIAIPELDFEMNYEHEHPIIENDEENNLPQLQRPVMEPGSRSTCRVVSAPSPDSICLRRLDEEESFYQMSTELTTCQETYCSPVLLRHWQEGDSCVVKSPGEGWVRARVDRMMEGGMVELLLYDHGSKFVGSVESLKPLPGKFCQVGPFCWTVELPNLLPAGGAKAWTGVACEKLQEILLGAGMDVDIEVGRKVTENKWQAVMFVKEKDEDSGPLDPEEFKYKSVGAMMIGLGMAIPTGKESRDNAELEGLNNNIVMKEAAINEGKNGLSWLIAEMPSSLVFAGFVSHVDWDCNLYMSSIQDNQDNLRIIASVLESKYSGSSPSPLDQQWCQGEACIAQFCLDKKWYRGEVLEVRDMGDCLVKFVDYGSEELCKAENMRKGLFLTDIPVQCFTVQMDIDPITMKWEEGVLNFIHKTVVEQVLQVTIIQKKDVFPLVVRLVTKAGLDIGELLVKNGYARGRGSVST